MIYFRAFYLSLLLGVGSCAESSESKIHSIFIPPPNWEIIDAGSLSPKVVAGFVKKSKAGFCPSMNLSIEQVDISLHKYVQEVKKLHEQDRTTRWRDLGFFKTLSGLARLTEIDSKSKWGDVRMLQMILVNDGKAYILTTAAPKEDFATFYPEIKKSLSSFVLAKDLFSLITDEEKKQKLLQKITDIKESYKELSLNREKYTPSFEKKWRELESFLKEKYADLGNFWQLEVLQSLQEDLLISQDAKDA